MVATLTALQPAPEPGNYVGPGSCGATACHGAIRPVAGARILQTEYTTWIAQDRHARATEVLSNPVSERMAKILGIGDPAKAPRCLACHSLDVPSAAQGRTFASDGVSCEACHGPATGWLGYHVTRDATHEESVKRGMYDTKDPVKRTEKCLTCHLGTADKFVDHEMIAGGHPDLVFELEAFSAAMPRHWKETSEGDMYTPVRTFAVGQLTHFRASLDRLSRRVKGSVWPEYSELDCFGCHHSLTRPEDSWRQANGYDHRARPGLPQLQVSRYLTARRVLAAYDAPAEQELAGVMDKLQIEASRLAVKPDEVVALANQARAIVDRGLAEAVRSTPSADAATSMLRGIYADVPQIADRGERAAEQAAMAAETLTAALAKGRGQDPLAAKPAFNDVFKEFESPSSYDPRRFVAAMKKVETATSPDAPPRAGSEQSNLDWALLDSLGQAPQTALIREYRLESGDVGREYASSESLARAPDAVTRYYEDKLFKLGWEQIERHAAISGYQKGRRIVVITRAGPDDPGSTPGAQLLKERAVPAGAKFFFAIETGPVHR